LSSLVVDASVAAKWFLREADAASALALLSTGLDLKAPAIVRQEVASAIIRAFRTGRIDRAAAEQLLANASGMLASAAIELIEPAPLHARAETIALDLKHAFIDCLYIALAEREGCELVATDATLLARAAQRFPFVRPL